MSAAATSQRPLLLSSHAFEQTIPPSIADGVAGLLAADRQIIIVTGKPDGRMGGFLADLSHSIARQDSLLRIRSPLGADEFHIALAGQLHLPTGSDTPGQIAARVGQRLLQPAPKGRFVLLCEGADHYELPTLEAVRQIGNYPVSIVLVGGHALKRRLRQRLLAPLRQRITHQLALNRRPPAWLWLVPALLLSSVLGLDYGWLPRLGQEETPPRPISGPPAAAAPAPATAGPAATEQPQAASEGGDLRLLLARELSHPPVQRP